MNTGIVVMAQVAVVVGKKAAVLLVVVTVGTKTKGD